MQFGSWQRNDSAGLDWPVEPSQRFSAKPFQTSTPYRQQHHRKKNCQQSKRSSTNVNGPLRKNRKASIHELNVHPINKQGRFPKLYQWAETPLPRSPSAPQISRRHNHQQQAHANQKKIRTGVPEIVGLIESLGTSIQPACQVNQPDSAPARRYKSRSPQFPGAIA